MALSFLLDTSVLKRLGQPAVRAVVEPLAAGAELGRASICDLEVGYSARNADEWDLLVGALEAFVRVETTAEHLRRALQVHEGVDQRRAPRQDAAVSVHRHVEQSRSGPGSRLATGSVTWTVSVR